MLYELFVVGSVPFILLMVAEVIALWISISYESGLSATVSMVLTAVTLAVFGNFNVFSVIKHHPWDTAIFVGLYFAAGLVWSFIKFRLFSSDRRELYDETLENFLRSKNVTSLTPALETAWIESLRFGEFHQDLRLVNRNGQDVWLVSPLAKRHKAQITTWATYWPWSLTWALFHDAIKRLWEELYNTLHTWYQKVSDSSFKGTEIAAPKKISE